MRKGDVRRQAILDTAERFFYEKGYERTSVQDVLNALDMSKGGFYHHFESKLSLLEAICEQHSETGYRRCENAVSQCKGNAVDKINLLFERGFFFGQDSVDFLGLMVRVIYRDGCVQLKEMLERTHVRRYLPLMNRIVHEGVEEKLFYTAHPDDVGRILLMLNNCMTDEIAEAIAQMDVGTGSLQGVLDLIVAYRGAAELLVNAPYGSIQLIELERASEIIRAMAIQDRRIAALA